MKYAYVTVDVFSDRKFAGNPVAVLPNAGGLSGERMQAIASEFNLAETAFVLPPKGSEADAEVRIFTPKKELPFAGHPNIGTAFALSAVMRDPKYAAKDCLIFEELAGLVRLEMLREKGAVVGARLAAPQRLSVCGQVPIEGVAAACSVQPADIETRVHQPQVVSCGTPFLAVELKSLDALSQATPRSELFLQSIGPETATGVLLYVRTSPELTLRARMFAPLYGIWEDPATGSGNAALAGFLASLDERRDMSLRAHVIQGVEMGRPSHLEVSATKTGGEIETISVAGRCVPMMRGELEV